MAFPIIQTADTKTGTVASNSSSWTLTYPTNLAAGDLILAFVSTDGDTDTTPSWPADWVQLVSGASVRAQTLILAKKKSLGTETGTFTLGLPASEQGAWRIFRITGWEGTIGTAWSGAGQGAVAGIASVPSSSDTPDPPNEGGAWGSADNLWFAVCSVDTSRTISIYPLPDNQTADISGGANGATLGICTTNSAVALLDPGTFTISTADDWEAATVVVQPGAVTPPVYVPRNPAHDFGSITNF